MWRMLVVVVACCAGSAAAQERALPLAVSIDGPARAGFERGRELYGRRHGQMNLACAHCHDQNWGKRLLAETISLPLEVPGVRR